MKKEWLLFKKLMHMETGVGWNPTNNSLDASDEWWETKLRENGEYVKFRNKDLSLVWFRYDKLFSDVAATGERARAPSQQTVHYIDDNEEVMKENDDFPDFEGHIGIDDSEYNEDRGIEHDVSFGIKEKNNMGNDIVFPSLSSLKRKFNGEDGKEKKKISGATSLKEDIHSLLKYLENKSTVTSTPSTDKDIESAMMILKNIPGIEHKTELWCYACNLLSKKEMRAIFLNQPDNDCRLAWLNLMEPWDVRHCALTDANIFCEDEPIEDEDGFQDDPEWLIVCKIIALSILTYFETYIHKVPCRTSERTDNRLLQEIFNHSGDTISRHFHRVLKVVGKLAEDIIKPHPEYNEGKGYHVPQHQRYKPFFDDCIGAIDGIHVKARLPQGKAIPYIGRKGAAHDNRIFEEAIRRPELNFPHPKGKKYYLVDAGYSHMPGYMGPYKDDLIVTGSSSQMIKPFKEAMTKAFNMTDMGLMSYFLSLEVKQGVNDIFMTQEHYAKEVLKRFRMDDCNRVNTLVDWGTKLSKGDEGKTVDPTRFKSLVGSLRYLTCTRPDILYGFDLMSRFMEELKRLIGRRPSESFVMFEVQRRIPVQHQLVVDDLIGRLLRDRLRWHPKPAPKPAQIVKIKGRNRTKTHSTLHALPNPYLATSRRTYRDANVYWTSSSSSAALTSEIGYLLATSSDRKRIGLEMYRSGVALTIFVEWSEEAEAID
ncbi:hypothetical protein ZIOFF_046009 [Zingiber officinale]|uniref:Reverse transcriptase Ty1/copia-type domain-containing protein n=1 Tax=Zingiber officinale TaxID=94328 RepID=A0A8J5L254_ZINOF|nr:hypothetical protein ZIOFF_046009 [Zingiber officinale]